MPKTSGTSTPSSPNKPTPSGSRQTLPVHPGSVSFYLPPNRPTHFAHIPTQLRPSSTPNAAHLPRQLRPHPKPKPPAPNPHHPDTETHTALNHARRRSCGGSRRPRTPHVNAGRLIPSCASRRINKQRKGNVLLCLFIKMCVSPVRSAQREWPCHCRGVGAASAPTFKNLCIVF